MTDFPLLDSARTEPGRLVLSEHAAIEPYVEKIGWRFWGLGADGVLFSPFEFLGEADRAPARDATRWNGKVFEASCEYYDHEPPAPGCLCGVYATESLWDAVKSGQQWQIGLSTQGPSPTVVLGRVELHTVVPYLNRGPGEGNYFPEIRGRRCVIRSLFLPRAWAGARDGNATARQLAVRYRCRVDTNFPASLPEAQVRRLLASLETFTRKYFRDAPLPPLVLEGGER